MWTNIEGKNVDIPEALRDEIQSRLDQLAERYRFVEEAHVVLSKQRNWHTTEITLHIKHQMLRAQERSDDMGVSVDQAMAKLETQLRRHKSRLVTRSRATDVRQAPALTTVEVNEPDEVYEAPRVVRVKTISAKPMTVEEAALQMELLGHDFYVFTNADSNALNVVYQRYNGDIGLIQPE